MNQDAQAKIKMINSSKLCLVFGLLGLIPVIGFPFALSALWISGRVRVREKIFWNAARPCRILGVVCAALGTVFWTGTLAIIVARAINMAQGLG